MTTRTIWQKLKSTKLWACVAGVAVGVALALGADADTIQTVTGAVTALISCVTYIVTEGHIDAQSVAQAVTLTAEAVEALTADDEEAGTE